MKSLNAETGAEKPRAEVYRPELTRLPPLTFWRRIFRVLARWACRLAVFLLTRCEVRGLENFPKEGPALIAVNHLGDADGFLGIAFFPASVDGMAKVELYDYPILGKLMDAYGAIWVHRGLADRRALRAALTGLQDGRMVGIAPEGRESLTGGLEKGTEGAAYLALKANAPVAPVTFTGTENARVYGNLKRLRRTPVSLTVGPTFRLPDLPDRRAAIKEGTEIIMRRLAKQLPPEYRGVYREEGSKL